eukprot:6212760-Pleurochrysis_carterae.AAC.4
MLRLARGRRQSGRCGGQADGARPCLCSQQVKARLHAGGRLGAEGTCGLRSDTATAAGGGALSGAARRGAGRMSATGGRLAARGAPPAGLHHRRFHRSGAG